MGLVIDSPTLAQHLAHFFDTAVATAAYEVRLKDDGQASSGSNARTAAKREPGTSAFQRSTVDWMAILPIEWLL